MTTYSIWPATDGPFTSSADDPVNLGHQFSVSAQAWVIGLRYFRGATNVNPDELRLWRADSSAAGTSLSFVVPPAASTLGWQNVLLATPVELTPAQIYKTVGHFPDHYVATSAYWTTGDGASGIVNGILTAQSNAAALGGQGTFRYGAAGQYPDGTFNGGGYWVDVVVTDVDPSGAVDVGQALELNSAQVITPVHVVDVGQALELDSAGVITAGSAPETSLRARVSGTEPTRFARGTEPIRQVSGREVGTQ